MPHSLLHAASQEKKCLWKFVVMQWLTFSVHSARILRSNHIEGLRNGPCATLSLTCRFPRKKMFVKICRNAVVDVFCSFSKDLTIESHWGLKKRALCHTLSYTPLPKKKMFVKICRNAVVDVFCSFSKDLTIESHWGLKKRALCHTLSYMPLPKKKNVCENLS